MRGKRKTFLIIDGNNLAHRCMYAYRDLKIVDKKTKEVTYTGLPYGFIVNLIFMNNKFHPDKMAIVWDGGIDRRRAIFPEYKMKRRKKQAAEDKNISDMKSAGVETRDYHTEMEALRVFARFLGVQQFLTPKEEADDVIGTLTKKYAETENIIIASNDHDFQQLLQYRGVKIFKAYGNKNEIITRKIFEQMYGFNPKFFPNVLAIGGDKSDEYIGIRGISEETAFNLVRDFGPTLTKVRKAAKSSKVPARVSKLLDTKFDDAILCKKLSKIVTDVKLESFRTCEQRLDLLKDMFKNYKYHSLLFPEKLTEIQKLAHKEIM